VSPSVHTSMHSIRMFLNRSNAQARSIPAQKISDPSTLPPSSVYLHCLPELCSQIGISPFHVTDNLMTHMGVSFLLLSLPGVAIWLSDVAFMKYVALMGQTRKEAETPWVELAYGWLPAVWASTLAYYLPFLMQEGGNLLPVCLWCNATRIL